MYYWRGAVPLNCTRLHCWDLDWTAGFSHTLHPTALTCTAFWTLDWTVPTCNEHVLNCRFLSDTAHYWTDLHCISMNCTALHCAALHWNVMHCAQLQCSALHCSALHCTALCKKSFFLSDKKVQKKSKRGFHCVAATVCTRQESQCLLYAGFFIMLITNSIHLYLYLIIDIFFHLQHLSFPFRNKISSNPTFYKDYI